MQILTEVLFSVKLKAVLLATQITKTEPARKR